MIPRLEWDSDDAAHCLRSGLPCVLLNCPLSTTERWTFEHLSSVIVQDFRCDVYCSRNNQRRFRYWDESKNINGYNFTPPTTKTTMTFQEWLSYHQTSHSSDSTEMRYLQQGVVAEMGPQMLDEYKRFSLEAARRFQNIGGWDSFTSNLLLCGAEGAITPVHFDEQENIFAQLSGVKRVRLFPPEAWGRLYPYPLGHPSDRQAQVTLPVVPGSTRLDDEAQREMFPAFESNDDPAIMEMHVDLVPGECLYVPQYWWHQMEAVTDNTSLAWWYLHGQKKPANPSGDKDDLSSIDKRSVSLIAIRRNMERLIGDMVGGGQEAHRFFLALAGGSVPIPPEELGGPNLGVTYLPRYHRFGERNSEGESFPVLALDVAAAASVRASPQWPGVAEQAIKFVSMVIEVRACVSCRRRRHS